MSRAGAQVAPVDQAITIPAGVPLHVRTTRSVALRIGTGVDAVLTEPVYVYDRLVLPKGAAVHGVVAELVAADRGIRTKALLNGDVTPLHDPVVAFRTVHLDQGDVPLDSLARVRDAKLVQFVPAAKRSLREQAKDLVRERVDSAKEQVLAPGKMDRALKLLYSQLPYHPQRIWAGTGLIADLQSAAEVRLPAALPTAVSTADAAALDKIDVRARLVTSLSSDRSQRGDPVRAVVLEPVFDAQHGLLLPEGAQLVGKVAEVRPSKSFARNGRLRFAFQSVERTGEDAARVHGTLTGAETNRAENLVIDAEGEAKASPDKNRFVAPLLLAVTVAAGRDRDEDGGLGRQAVAANGFGLIARVVALTVNNKDVSTGFGAYGFAKSVYFRFLARGHAVTFPDDTLVEVQISAR